MSGSIHEVRRDAFNYVWDHSIEPVLEVESGEVIELHARDASDEQIHKGSTAADVPRIDFSHINPVSGPVYVKGAVAGDALAVELLEFRPGDWGWTAIIPGFGLLADEFTEPWLRISSVASDGVHFSDNITVPLRPFPGTIGVALPEPGQHPILPPSRWGGNLDTRHLTAGATLYLPVGVEGALLSLGDTQPPRATARCVAPRSRARWTSSCGCRFERTSQSRHPRSTLQPRPSRVRFTSARASVRTCSAPPVTRPVG